MVCPSGLRVVPLFVKGSQVLQKLKLEDAQAYHTHTHTHTHKHTHTGCDLMNLLFCWKLGKYSKSDLIKLCLKPT